jgi:cell division protease FtsH
LNKTMYICLAAALVVVIAGAVMPMINDVDIMSRALLVTGCLAAAAILLFGPRRRRTPAFTRVGHDAVKYTAPPTTFDDVAANAEARQSLMELVDYIRCPEKYLSHGARMPRGVLLYGPPGTGKTLLAQALAGEAGVPFFAMSGSDFVQMYVGVGAGRVRELFKNARKAGKCVIFIDEIDALGKRRSDAASEERDQTLNALLSEMSGFRSGDGIIVLAATNRLETLDPALLRPGRFDRQIEVGLPGKSERLDILQLHSRNKPLAGDVDLEQLAADTCAFSGASLEALLNEAAMLAAQRNASAIERADIDRAFIRTVAGADRSPSANAEELCAIALHEAGHAIVTRCLMPESRIKRISILPAGRGAAGYNLAIPQERVLIKKRDMENQIAVLMGGRAAEMLINGDDGLTSGASGDLARAAELAGVMVTELGMGDDPAVSLRAVSAAAGCGMNAEQAVRGLLDQMYARAEAILTENAGALVQLVQVLLERETLDEDEINDILNVAA